jgi:decaprenyl-phosphate phosphoribosyltransferase
VRSGRQVVATGAGGTAAARALLEASRPRQWIKNLLVLAAPLSAGVLTHAGVAARAAAAVAAFCLLSSGAYLLNDSRDAAHDRLHPTKRLRPVASGRLPVPAAVASGVTMTGAGLVVAGLIRPEMLAVAIAYVGISAAYTLWLRGVEVLDVAAVAGLFILRAVAGGAATDVRLSRWFLIVASFSALFVVAGKRSSELGSIEGHAARPALEAYTLEYLRYLWMMASTVAVAAYCIWAFSRTGPSEFHWFEASIVPFVLGVMRYALLIDSHRGAAPEHAIFEDAHLRTIALVWLGTFVAGAYTAAAS